MHPATYLICSATVFTVGCLAGSDPSFWVGTAAAFASDSAMVHQDVWQPITKQRRLLLGKSSYLYYIAEIEGHLAVPTGQTYVLYMVSY